MKSAVFRRGAWVALLLVASAALAATAAAHADREALVVPHQAVLHPISEPVPRIMLQCHALLQRGAWGIYW